jgi:hypothetical protein
VLEGEVAGLRRLLEMHQSSELTPARFLGVAQSAAVLNQAATVLVGNRGCAKFRLAPLRSVPRFHSGRQKTHSGGGRSIAGYACR